MTKRRDLLWAALIAIGLQLAALAATDWGSLGRIRQALGQFRQPAARGFAIPKAPFYLAAAKILLFYILLGAFMGVVLWTIARILASQRDTEGTWVTSRRRCYKVFLIFLGVVTVYMYFHAMLLYPALFSSSWRWGALAGSPTFVWIYGLVGPITVALVVLLLLRKRYQEVGGWLRRRFWLPVLILILAGGGIGGWYWFSRPRNANQGPNVIVLGLDAIRPDHVSGLGWIRKTTPNLDRFLRDSIVFTDCFVPLGRTGPSWMSILTGCFPPKSTHRCDLMPKEMRVPPVKTLAGHLRELGYETSYFLDNSAFMAIEPEMGFSHIWQPKPHVVWFGMSFFPMHLMMYYYCLNNELGFFYEPMLRANEAFSSVYDWRPFARRIKWHLQTMKGKEKFFLAAHTCIAHAPFSVRYPYSTYFPPPRPKPEENLPSMPENRFSFRWPFNQMLWEKEIEKRSEIRNMARLFSQEYNLYDSLVRETDDWLGAVLDAIKKLDLYDNSLIVVLSDHGEDLFRNDHNYPYFTSNHGWHVWGDDSYRAVLAIKLPQSKYAGRQVPWLVRSIDVAPTVLDLLGREPLPEAEGVSLVPQIEDPSRDPDLFTYCEAGLTIGKAWFIPGHRQYPFPHFVAFQYVDPDTFRIYRRREYMPGFVMAKDRAVRTGRWKLIAYPMEGEPFSYKTTLHDVRKDPTNIEDSSTSYPAVVRAMRSRMARFIDADAATYGFEWRWLDIATTATVAADAPTTGQP